MYYDMYITIYRYIRVPSVYMTATMRSRVTDICLHDGVRFDVGEFDIQVRQTLATRHSPTYPTTTPAESSGQKGFNGLLLLLLYFPTFPPRVFFFYILRQYILYHIIRRYSIMCNVYMRAYDVGLRQLQRSCKVCYYNRLLNFQLRNTVECKYILMFGCTRHMSDKNVRIMFDHTRDDGNTSVIMRQFQHVGKIEMFKKTLLTESAAAAVSV